MKIRYIKFIFAIVYICLHVFFFQVNNFNILLNILLLDKTFLNLILIFLLLMHILEEKNNCKVFYPVGFITDIDTFCVIFGSKSINECNQILYKRSTLLFCYILILASTHCILFNFNLSNVSWLTNIQFFSNILSGTHLKCISDPKRMLTLRSFGSVETRFQYIIYERNVLEKIFPLNRHIFIVAILWDENQKCIINLSNIKPYHETPVSNTIRLHRLPYRYLCPFVVAILFLFFLISFSCFIRKTFS
ncbi:hypothetical protein AGLY_014305 [Aphis glycines]|uniref:Uncharacterized protein n=1 Tax=Aphis glycines TaxID=307491 RepID=A0A6G0T5S0_APHGL|nr:hypothetical protein AGLY_014305 [Aphis glycines]